MRKSEVEFHSDGYRPARPAVNVKVYKSLDSVELPMCLGGSRDPATEPDPKKITWHYTADGFTHEYIEGLSDYTLESAFSAACESGWEWLNDEAQRIFGNHVKVYSEGRSGGWAVVDGLPDFEEWDAIMLGKWSRFAKVARLTADDIPRQTMDMIYFNIYEPEQERLAAEVALLDDDAGSVLVGKLLLTDSRFRGQ